MPIFTCVHLLSIKVFESQLCTLESIFGSSYQCPTRLSHGSPYAPCFMRFLLSHPYLGASPCYQVFAWWNILIYLQSSRLTYLTGPVYAMDHDVGPSKMAFSNGPCSCPTSMIWLLKNIVLKALGPSLGVNRMWTKKNDHAPKSECADFF